MEPIKIFVSYSHLDSRWLEDYQYNPYDSKSSKQDTNLIPWLQKSLSVRHNVSFWYDPALVHEPGEEWKPIIRQQIEQADFCILLLSQDFFNSQFIREVELPLIKERLDLRKLRVIPILVNRVSWKVVSYEFLWLQSRQIILGEQFPLIDYIDHPASLSKARSDVLEAIDAKLDNYRLNPAIDSVEDSQGAETTFTIDPPADGPLPTFAEKSTANKPPAVQPANDNASPLKYSRKKHFSILALMLSIVTIAYLVFRITSTDQSPQAGRPGDEAGAASDSRLETQLKQLSDSSLADSAAHRTVADKKELVSGRENRISQPAKSATLPKVLNREYINTFHMMFILIPAGEFRMGSKSDQESEEAKPVHKVRFAKPFYIGKYEVTQREWFEVMSRSLQDQEYRGQKPKVFRGIGDSYPMYYVSQEDALSFIRRLNARENTTKYRLPTEAEWEYAARAGCTEDSAAELEKYGWAGEDISSGVLHLIGTKKANNWGLYDMLGNAAELILNFYPRYPASMVTDPRPAIAADGSFCLRGGSSIDEPYMCQFSHRQLLSGNSSSSYTGFRVVKEID